MTKTIYNVENLRSDRFDKTNFLQRYPELKKKINFLHKDHQLQDPFDFVDNAVGESSYLQEDMVL